MKKVKFQNGKFGVRTYWFFGWYFLDLDCKTFSRKIDSRGFNSCVGSEKDADDAISFRNLKYEICETKPYEPKPYERGDI